jgi:chromosome segregation ATPase
MRSLPLFVFALFVATVALGDGHSRHSTHIINTDDDGFEFQFIRDDGDAWASLKRDGVRYVTHDRGVLEDIEDAMRPYRELSQEHSAIGRKHSELGREHSALGREHSRVGREHSRISRDVSAGRISESEADQRRRELELEQRGLEDKQRALEARQRDLEDEQRAVEAKQRAAEREVNREIEKVFERAVRDGKAKRD